MLYKLNLAYLAGIIDADGTIGIKKSTYSMRVRKDSTQPTYCERVCVKQVEPHAIYMLHQTFGGYRFIEKSYAAKGKSLYGWQVTNIKAATAIKALYPYLRIKRAQASNCLSLRRVKERSKIARMAIGRGHVGSAIRPAHLGRRMETHYQYAHKLNQVGRGDDRNGSAGT